MTASPYDAGYYESTGLAEDRIALWWYARVIRHLRPLGGRLLDFGCGTGQLLKRLSRYFDAVGYDVSAEARTRCREVAPAATILDSLDSIAPASFEVVVSLHTLEHIPEPAGVVQQLAAKLRAAGLFLFVVPNPDGLGRRLKQQRWFAYRDPTHCSLLSRGEWESMVRRAGLSIVSVRGDGLWDAPYVPLLPTALQRLLFGAPAGLQLLSPAARPFLPAMLGECLVVTAEKPRTSL